jgi:hypothetical protein
VGIFVLLPLFGEFHLLVFAGVRQQRYRAILRRKRQKKHIAAPEISSVTRQKHT